MKKITRRSFLEKSAKLTIAGTSIAFIGAGGCSFVADIPQLSSEQYAIEGNNLSVFLDKIPELKKIASSVKIYDSKLDDKLIIAKKSETEYISASLLCTHAGGEVEYMADKGTFNCVSISGSKFDLEGQVVSGPAEKQLTVYSNTLNDQMLQIQLS